MRQTIDEEIAEYDKEQRATPITVININDLSPEIVLTTIRPFVQIPRYTANRRPMIETEITPLLAHYANLHSRLGELLGIVAHQVRMYELEGARDQGKTARTKREIIEEARKDVKILWETCRSLSFSQQSFLKPVE